jgi:hypothetical protein
VVVSYIDYQKALGEDTTKAEEQPHVDFSWGKKSDPSDKFEVYGTLYLKDGKAAIAHLYTWSDGGLDWCAEIEKRFADMGYPCKIKSISGGNGHESIVLDPL